MNATQRHLWAEDELRHADLGDRRLNRRLTRLVGDLPPHPPPPAPPACAPCPATKPASRFWPTDAVGAPAILAAPRRRTHDRLPTDGQAVLAVQDTTVLNFSHHPATA